MIELDPTCEPDLFPCWEHYSTRNATQRPVRWVIELATAALKLRVQSLPNNPSYEEAAKAKAAAWALCELLNEQWRDCVREPFQFYPGTDSTKDSEVPEEVKAQGRLLLEALGIRTVSQPFTRRI